MADTSSEVQFQVIGELDGMQADRAAPRYLLMSQDGLSGALARREGDRFIPIAGPFSFDAIRRCAENVLSGNQRAVTWPQAQIAMAIGCGVFFTLYGRELTAADTAAEPNS
ncbi:hypothetical protein [Ancylobacter oerskovii]|uniref:Uncharacterized protein n=1 Tax=Ancylobacter oerskovii TaxID=459519 RepID=A0ABW4YRB1_9HYPH|nr:hypothetical protein [Ancylobacter oerskovii]MBS7545665.1 hypothetical protein [Ancylobacter oerskovii]